MNKEEKNKVEEKDLEAKFELMTLINALTAGSASHRLRTTIVTVG